VEIESTQSGVEVAQRLPRRGILAAGIGGAAVSLLPFLSGRASATTPPPAASTTTAPPKRPTTDDTSLLGFALQAELTAESLYAAGIAGVQGWSDEQAAVMTTLRQAHLAFGNAFSGLLGSAGAPTRNDDLFNQWTSKFSGSADDVLKAAADLESSLVATHLDMLGKLQGVNGAALSASVQISEARHVTVLRTLAGVTDEAELLVDNEADSLQGAG
jgi:hypothetical protein